MAARDVLVIGGGVFGLWTALFCARAGLSVTVAEAAQVGAGASGGLVGALTRHQPKGWRALKAFQLQGLVEIGARAQELAAETGRDPGFRRVGRLMPLGDAGARAGAEADAAAAGAVWGPAGEIRVLDGPPSAFAPHLDAEAFRHGALTDTLSGRVAPRAWVGAVAAAVRQRGEIRERWPVAQIDPGTMRAAGPGGEIAAGHIVIAAGWQSGDLAAPLGAAPGRAVKGQAALLAARLPADMPVIAGRGLYIVAQGPDRVAVGSTSEADLTDTGTDGVLDGVITAAAALCPALAGAEVVERWAGIRPRPPGREPTIGRLPGQERIWLAGGGYKIGLAIAHLAGEALAGAIAGHTPRVALPADFAVPVKQP